MVLDAAVGEGAQERDLVVGPKSAESAGRADAGRSVPEEIGRPVLLVVHAFEALAVEPEQSGVHQPDQPERFVAPGRIDHVRQDTVLRRRTGPAAFGAERRRDRVATGLAHQVEHVGNHPGFGNPAVDQSMHFPVADMHDAVRRRDVEQRFGERALKVSHDRDQVPVAGFAGNHDRVAALKVGKR